MSVKVINKYTYIIDFSDETVVVTVKMRKSLVDKIDEAVRRHNFASRSDFIRLAVMKMLNELDGKEENKKQNENGIKVVVW